MNEVETFAKAGETAGAAVGTGVQTIRKGAIRASRQLAEEVSEQGTAGRVRDAGASTQAVLADRVTGARRELAARLAPAPPPQPRRGRRWPWMLLLIASLASAVAAVVLARRPQPIDTPGPMQPTPPRPQDPTAHHGNGAVRVDDSSTWRD